MKILVFEYLVGGGYNQQDLPEALAREGLLMLQALLGDFASLPGHNLTVMLDWRFAGRADLAEAWQTVVVDAHHDCAEVFARLVATVDAVWPIAPEFDGILQRLCAVVEQQQKRLLTPNAAAVALAGDKYLTYLRLGQRAIPTVPSQLADQADLPPGEWLVKPRDGAGCADSFVFQTGEPFPRSANFIVQPHVSGEKLSLCCLFKDGQSWLLSVNCQHFDLVDGRYQLRAITVNDPVSPQPYEDLVAQIGLAFPELWGYAGIDLLLTSAGLRVLEINPRLTTSCVALKAALGINLADLVLQLCEDSPRIQPCRNEAVNVRVA